MINMSADKWSGVPLGPPDAILGITEAFKADKNAAKINLGVGAYRDELGRPFVLESVKKAEGLIGERYPEKEYAGIGGLPEFCGLSAKLAFGEGSGLLSEQRV
jgi:aspartate aminotransferase